MTDAEELAVAIFLWRDYRCPPNPDMKELLTGVHLRVADRALELADRGGCKQQYLQLLSVVPVFEVTVKEVEPWGDSPLTPTEYQRSVIMPKRKRKKRDRCNGKRNTVSRI